MDGTLHDSGILATSQAILLLILSFFSSFLFLSFFLSFSFLPSFLPSSLPPSLPSLSLFSFFLFLLSMAAPAVYGGSLARGRIRATAAGLHHSHSNSGSEPHLQPTPQLPAMPDP